MTTTDSDHLLLIIIGVLLILLFIASNSCSHAAGQATEHAWLHHYEHNQKKGAQ